MATTTPPELDAQRPADRAVIGIVATNGAILLWALWQQWSILQLLWPFWLQSLIIGFYARERLRRYAASGAGGTSVQPGMHNLFALHYGGFHLFYLFFLIALTVTPDAAGYIEVTNTATGRVSAVYIGHVQPLDYLAYVLITFGFWRAHRASHREHVEADLAASPTVGMLMFLPYLRVLPMHLSIMAAVALGAGGAIGIVILLKTCVDVAMHSIEHRSLQPPPPPQRFVN